MKAIRGDNPRTTNQRVYLMPVVPSPPPEKPRRPTWNSFLSLSLSLSTSACLSSIYLSICSSPSRFTLFPSLSFSLILSPRLSRRPPFHPYTLAPASSRCCSRICHYATDITNPHSLLSLLLFSRTHSLDSLPSLPHFPAALFATCRTLAHPRDLAQSVLLY